MDAMRLIDIEAPDASSIEPGVRLDRYPNAAWTSPSGRTMWGDNRLGLVEDGVAVYPLRARAHYLDDDTIALVVNGALWLLEREPDVGFQPVDWVAADGDGFAAVVLGDDGILFDGRVFLRGDHAWMVRGEGRVDADYWVRGRAEVRPSSGGAASPRWCLEAHDGSHWKALELPPPPPVCSRFPPEHDARLQAMEEAAERREPALLRFHGAIPFPAADLDRVPATEPSSFAWTDGEHTVAFAPEPSEYGPQYRALLVRDKLVPIEDAGSLGSTQLHARVNAAPVTGLGRLLLLQPQRRRILEVHPVSGASRVLFAWEETEALMGAACLAQGATLVQLAGTPKIAPHGRIGQPVSRRVILAADASAPATGKRPRGRRGRGAPPRLPGERMQNASRSVVSSPDGRHLYTLMTVEAGAPHWIHIERFEEGALHAVATLELPPLTPGLGTRSPSGGLFRTSAVRPPRLSRLPDGRLFVHLGRLAFELRHTV